MSSSNFQYSISVAYLVTSYAHMYIIHFGPRLPEAWCGRCDANNRFYVT